MDNNKIINIDNVGPAASKKKKIIRIITAASLLTAGAAVFIIFSSAAKTDTVKLKSYTSSKVYSGQLVSSTEASGTVILPAQVTIVSSQDGYADELFTEEGSLITPEDVLAAIEVPDLEDERDELTVSLKQAYIELESIQTDYEYQIKEAQLNIRRLLKDILEAAEDVKAQKELLELKSSRLDDYEDAVDVLEALEEEKEDYEITLEKAKINMEIDLRKQQAEIDQISVNLKNTKAEMERMRIKSPISGEVLSVNEDLAISGSYIEAEDSLFIVADRSSVFIDFEVYEQYVDLLEIGGQMTVTIGSDTMNAEIIKIGKIASMDDDGLSAMVTVRARPDTEKSLTPGASAVASIRLGVEDNVLLLPRGAYLTTGSGKWVYRIDGNKAYKTEVTLGSIEGSEVEILSGLKKGDSVITSSYQNFIDEEVIELQ